MEEEKRTLEEEFLDLPIEDFNSPQYSIFLEQLFILGSTPPETFEVYPGFKVTLRVLSPIENLEIAKKVDLCSGFSSREITLKLETLSRAIERINGQSLRFSDSMMREWQEFRNTDDKPTEWEQQRYIIQYRFKQFAVEEIFKKYQELLKKQEQVLKELKKN